MKIYLVRHGESQSNLLKIYNTVDKDLNDTGIRQAEGLIDDVDKIDYDVIISSPLVRAYHTAEIINVHHKEIMKYCGLDTLAMVKVWQKLTEVVGSNP